jgi:TorA maturation chaperone TorD
MTSIQPEITIPGDESALLAHFRSAVAEDLRELAVLQDGELTVPLLEELKQLNFPENFGLRLQSDAGKEASSFMRKAVAELPLPIEKKLVEELAVDYAAIFLNNSLHASPYESVWLTEDGLTRQAPMFQVRKWYEKYTLVAQNWRARPDDHLVLQLQFLSHLFALDEQLDTLRQAAQFLDEHLSRWVAQFASRVATRCDTAFYAGVTILTAQYLDEMRDILAQVLGEPRPSPEAIEQRMKPKVDPSEVNFCSPRFENEDLPPEV